MSAFIILDVKPILADLFNKVPGLTHQDEDIEDFLCALWESVQDPELTLSLLLDQTNRYNDIDHPFAEQCWRLGYALQHQLEALGYYSGPEQRDYYFSRRHGKYCIVVEKFQRKMEGVPDAPF
jgi:hypothetical protein